jgi:hypothetical protein
MTTHELLGRLQYDLESVASGVATADQSTTALVAQVEGFAGSAQSTIAGHNQEIIDVLTLKFAEQSAQLSNIVSLRTSR